jgi:ACR3 family arsenite transporter
MEQAKKTGIGFFEKFLSVWVLLCMGIGIAVGKFIPAIPEFLNQFEVENINIPIAILIWLMIFPMMLKIDFVSVKQVGKQPKGLFLSWATSWILEPLGIFGLGTLFFFVIYKGLIPEELARDYYAGAILLAASPCTAMVFVWSRMSKGNPAYTLVQVATNDLIILVLFVPTVALMLGVSGFFIPWGTLFLSILLFVVVPLVLAVVTRSIIIKKKGVEFLEQKVLPKFNPVTMIGLLLTLVIIFSLQAELIIANPLHIVLIAIPLVIHSSLVFAIAYSAAKILKLPHDIAGPAGLIGASNFFELAVAVAIALYPANPGVALATIVGVLVEVPLMLLLVKIVNGTKKYFTKEPENNYGEEPQNEPM